VDGLRTQRRQIVGQTQGLPVVTDPNVRTNAGPGGNEDEIYVLRASDIVLWESGVRARVLAIVADSHPITQPPNTNLSVCRVALSALGDVTAKMTAQTIARPML
jgi:hypothetical protein